MSIQNIEQLSVRIGVATDQLEDAVTSVKAAEGTVIDGSGAAAQSAREAATSATQSAFSATQSANSAATSSSASSSARGSANQAISQVELAKAEVSKAEAQANLASASAEEAAQSALDIQNFTPTLPENLVTDAPRNNKLYGRIDGAWALVPTGGGGSGGTGTGTGSVNSVNGIAPDASGNVSVPIPQPDAQIKSDWNATSGSAQILNKPALFNGTYSALTGKPTLFDGNYLSLTNKPTLFSGDYRELTNKPFIPASFSGSYLDLTNKPTLFSGDYNDLRNKPVLNGSGETVDGLGDAPEDGKWYTRKDGQWQEIEAGVAFSGDYRDLTNKPPLNTDGSVGGTGFNGDYNDLVNKPPLITSNSQLFNGNQYIGDAPYDGGEYYRKNGKWHAAYEPSKDYYIPIAAHDIVNLYGDEMRGLFLNSNARGWHNHPKKRQGYIHYFERRSPNPFVPQRLNELTYMGFLGRFGAYVVLNGTDILTYSIESREVVLPSGIYAFQMGEFPREHLLHDFMGIVEVTRVPYDNNLADGSYEFSGYPNDPFLRYGVDNTNYDIAPFKDEKLPNGDRIEVDRYVDIAQDAGNKMVPIYTIHTIDTGEWGLDGEGETRARGIITNTYQMDAVTGELTLMSGSQSAVIDAPYDHKTYVRKNQKWVEADIPRDTLDLTNGAEFVSNPPKDGKKYYRTSTGWSEATYIPQAGAFPVVHSNKLYYQNQLFSYWQGQNPNTPMNVKFLEAILGGVTYPRATKGDVFTAEGIELLPDGRFYFNSGDFKSPSALYNKTGYIEVVKIPSGSTNPPAMEVKAYVMGISTWKPTAVYYFNKTTGLWTLPDTTPATPTTSVVNKRTGTAFEEWIGTQAQYDAIATPDANTRYWITEE